MQRLLAGLGVCRADDHRRVFAAFAGALARLLAPQAGPSAGQRR